MAENLNVNFILNHFYHWLDGIVSGIANMQAEMGFFTLRHLKKESSHPSMHLGHLHFHIVSVVSSV